MINKNSNGAAKNKAKGADNATSTASASSVGFEISEFSTEPSVEDDETDGARVRHNGPIFVKSLV